MRINRILMVVILLAASAAYAEEIQIKDGTPFTYAYLECSGSYDQITAKIGEFVVMFFSQGLTPMGPVIGLYYNSPEEVSEADLKWAVGFPIDSKADVKEPLKKAEFKYEKIIYYLYTGPYEEVGETYTKIFQFITEKGYKQAGPVLEKYLDDPSAVVPEKLRTEIIIPVTK